MYVGRFPLGLSRARRPFPSLPGATGIRVTSSMVPPSAWPTILPPPVCSPTCHSPRGSRPRPFRWRPTLPEACLAESGSGTSTSMTRLCTAGTPGIPGMDTGRGVTVTSGPTRGCRSVPSPWYLPMRGLRPGTAPPAFPSASPGLRGGDPDGMRGGTVDGLTRGGDRRRSGGPVPTASAFTRSTGGPRTRRSCTPPRPSM